MRISDWSSDVCSSDLVFIIRGTIVDSIRYAAIAEGKTAFGMMQSPLGRFLVAGRFMRGFYGALKAVTFGWVLLFQPWQALDPAWWPAWSGTVATVTAALVYASVLVCLVRGLPVVIAFIVAQRVFRRNRQAEEVR